MFIFSLEDSNKVFVLTWFFLIGSKSISEKFGISWRASFAGYEAFLHSWILPSRFSNNPFCSVKVGLGKIISAIDAFLSPWDPW